MSDAVAAEVPIRSPFALMLPELAQVIAERAAKLDLPARRCSPLSNPRLPGHVDGEDDDEL
jgi:hypothetical protein